MIFDNRLCLVMKDNGEGEPPRRVNSLQEARGYNDNKYGVFYTVNGFSEFTRKKDKLSNFLAWAIDIDDIPKQEQRRLITASPLMPSLVIESKRGYHVHWFSKDGKTDRHAEIMERLVSHFKADTRAKDLCRFLRMPGFYHWKDEKDPFLVEWAVDEPKRMYTQEQMIVAFKCVKKKFVYEMPQKNSFEYDNIKALEVLSGKPEVNGDTFTFKKNTSGCQIFVNGKSTSTWIDRNGRIGSSDRGGPTIVQYLKWYGHSFKETINILNNYGIKST